MSQPSEWSIEDLKRNVYLSAMAMQRDHRHHIDVTEVHNRLRKLGILPEDYMPKPVGFTLTITGEIPGGYESHNRRGMSIMDYLTDLASRGLARQRIRVDATTVAIDGELPPVESKEDPEDEEYDEEEEKVEP